MSYFANVELSSTPGIYNVAQVIRADQSFVDNLPGKWVQCDYNTYGNVHYAPSPPAEPFTPDGKPPMRANYPGIGFIYDTHYTVGAYFGVFYAPNPGPGFVLNTNTFLWEKI